MNKDLRDYILKAIDLEISTSELYKLFAEKCPEDAKFWMQLQIEEMNHAALLRAGLDFAGYDKFPGGLLPEHLSEIDKSISMIRKSMESFRNKPERMISFSIAFDLENSAGELHFQQFMDSKNEDALSALFRKLNRADSHHADRIQTYYNTIANI